MFDIGFEAQRPADRIHPPGALAKRFRNRGSAGDLGTGAGTSCEDARVSQIEQSD